ncbi:Adenylate and Guanylate cyclase catalytic domain protein [compost metagenome]
MLERSAHGGFTLNQPHLDPVVRHLLWRFDAPPERVWPLVSDTDRTNRLFKLAPVSYDVSPNPRGGIKRRASAWLGPLPCRWEERPYEWVEGKAFSVRREYQGGPFRTFRHEISLEPDGTGTRVSILVAYTPRHALAKPLARSYANATIKLFEQAYRDYAQVLRGERSIESLSPVANPTSVQAERGEAIARDLVALGFDEMLVARLVFHVLSGPEEELDKMRPFALATAWRVHRREMLKLFLHATRLGLLELKWDLLCPACRGPRERVGTLSLLSSQAHCDACNIRIDADFGQSVELSFRPSPSLRKVERRFFCVGSPAWTPHVVFQALLEPGAPQDVALTLAPGTYRLRSPQVSNQLTITLRDEAPDAGATQLVRITPEGFTPGMLDQDHAVLRLRLETDVPVQVCLERTAWADDVVTGAYVSTLQEFRSLFSAEVLAPGLELGVGKVAIMFTDLKSSTAMYEQLGDATAFSLVQTHFRILEAAIAANNGSVVKTVGDAIMASFHDVTDCVRAAFEIQASVARYNAGHPDKPAPIVVKLGAHAGPCIAVNLNDRLDFFGTTVNMAARVQNEAVGEDVVLSQAVLADPGVQALLAELPTARRERFDVTLRGLSASYELTRFVPNAQADALGKLRLFTDALG